MLETQSHSQGLSPSSDRVQTRTISPQRNYNLRQILWSSHPTTRSHPLFWESSALLRPKDYLLWISVKMVGLASPAIKAVSTLSISRCNQIYMEWTSGQVSRANSSRYETLLQSTSRTLLVNSGSVVTGQTQERMEEEDCHLPLVSFVHCGTYFILISYFIQADDGVPTSNPEVIIVGSPLDGTKNPHVCVGKAFADITGVVVYQYVSCTPLMLELSHSLAFRFGFYYILPTTAPTIVATPDPTVPATSLTSIQDDCVITIGDYNVSIFVDIVLVLILIPAGRELDAHLIISQDCCDPYRQFFAHA